MLDTFIRVEVYARSKKKAETAANNALTEIMRLEALLDRHREVRPETVAAINAAAGEAAVVVDRELYSFLKEAAHLSELSEGKFSLLLGPLLDRWQQADTEKKLPSLDEIIALLPKGRLRFSEIDSSVMLDGRGEALDLGGIAKGYIIDRAAEILRTEGIKSGLIDAGGDIITIGKKPRGKLWRIGIADPQAPGSVLGSVEVAGTSIITSGTYQRYFELAGERYHHILDPVTGYPSKGIAAATVVAHSASEADFLGTLLMILPPEEGLRFTEEHFPNAAVLIIDEREELFMNENMEEIFTLHKGG